MSASTIVISRSHDDSADRRNFENSLVETLRSMGAPRVLIVPPLCYLKDANEALKVLRSTIDGLVFASWLYPRAALWTLDYLGIKSPDRTLRCLNLADFTSPEACAHALLEGRQPANPATQVQTFDEDTPPRWYPVIDHSACINCKQCYDFCLFGVYGLDQDRHVSVANPDSCKNGCPACARICPTSAVIFPLYVADPKIAGAAVPRPPDKLPDQQPRQSSGDELDGLIDELDELDA